MKELSDKELLEAYCESENKAFIEELYLRYSKMVYRVALKYSANNSDAEDAMQIVFIDIMREAHQLKTKENIKSWIIRMLINNCKDNKKMERRRRNRQEIVSKRRPTYTEPKYEDDAIKKVVLQSVNQLPERYRAPLLLHYFEEFSFADMAISLNLPEKTARTQIARGLERLKKILTTAGFVIPIVTIAQAMQSASVHANEVANFDSSFIYQASNTAPLKIAATKVLVTSSTASFTWLVPIVCGVLMVVLPAYYFFSKTPKSDEKPNPIKVQMQMKFSSTREKNVKLLSFEGEKAKENWEEFNGSVTLEKEGGIKNKPCLKMGENSAIALNIDGMKFPIQITIKSDHIVTDNMKLIDYLNWSENNESIGIAKINEPSRQSFLKGENGTRFSAMIGSWVTRIFVIYEDRIENFRSNRLVSCQKFLDKPKGKLFLYSLEGLYLDNVKIEEINSFTSKSYLEQSEMYNELYSYVEKNAYAIELNNSFEKTEIAQKFFRLNGFYPILVFVKSIDFTNKHSLQKETPLNLK